MACKVFKKMDLINSRVNSYLESTETLPEKTLNLSKWKRKLQAIPSPKNGDSDIFLEEIKEFIEVIISSICSKKHVLQFHNLTAGFIVLQNILEDNSRDHLINNIAKLVFDVIIEENTNCWLAKRELLRVFNKWFATVKKRVNVKPLPGIYLLKMVDSLTVSGDYDLQVNILETIFRMYGQEIINERLRDMIPESQELSQSFSEIRPDSFDEDCRTFLNVINRKSDKIFSLVCASVLLDGRSCDPPLDNIEGFWVDFNTIDKAITCYYVGLSFDDNIWDLLMLFPSEINTVHAGMSKNYPESYAIQFLLKGKLVTSDVKETDVIGKVKDVTFIISRSERAEKLVNQILPKMLENMISEPIKLLASSSTQVKTYKPLDIKISKDCYRRRSASSVASASTSFNLSFDASSKAHNSLTSEDESDARNISSIKDHDDISEQNNDDALNSRSIKILASNRSLLSSDFNLTIESEEKMQKLDNTSKKQESYQKVSSSGPHKMSEGSLNIIPKVSKSIEPKVNPRRRNASETPDTMTKEKNQESDSKISSSAPNKTDSEGSKNIPKISKPREELDRRTNQREIMEDRIDTVKNRNKETLKAKEDAQESDPRISSSDQCDQTVNECPEEIPKISRSLDQKVYSRRRHGEELEPMINSPVIGRNTVQEGSRAVQKISKEKVLNIETAHESDPRISSSDQYKTVDEYPESLPKISSSIKRNPCRSVRSREVLGSKPISLNRLEERRTNSSSHEYETANEGYIKISKSLPNFEENKIVLKSYPELTEDKTNLRTPDLNQDSYPEITEDFDSLEVNIPSYANKENINNSDVPSLDDSMDFAEEIITTGKIIDIPNSTHEVVLHEETDRDNNHSGRPQILSDIVIAPATEEKKTPSKIKPTLERVNVGIEKSPLKIVRMNKTLRTYPAKNKSKLKNESESVKALFKDDQNLKEPNLTQLNDKSNTTKSKMISDVIGQTAAEFKPAKSKTAAECKPAKSKTAAECKPAKSKTAAECKPDSKVASPEEPNENHISHQHLIIRVEKMDIHNINSREYPSHDTAKHKELDRQPGKVLNESVNILETQKRDEPLIREEGNTSEGYLNELKIQDNATENKEVSENSWDELVSKRKESSQGEKIDEKATKMLEAKMAQRYSKKEKKKRKKYVLSSSSDEESVFAENKFSKTDINQTSKRDSIQIESSNKSNEIVSRDISDEKSKRKQKKVEENTKKVKMSETLNMDESMTVLETEKSRRYPKRERRKPTRYISSDEESVFSEDSPKKNSMKKLNESFGRYPSQTESTNKNIYQCKKVSNERSKSNNRNIKKRNQKSEVETAYVNENNIEDIDHEMMQDIEKIDTNYQDQNEVNDVKDKIGGKTLLESLLESPKSVVENVVSVQQRLTGESETIENIQKLVDAQYDLSTQDYNCVSSIDDSVEYDKIGKEDLTEIPIENEVQVNRVDGNEHILDNDPISDVSNNINNENVTDQLVEEEIINNEVQNNQRVVSFDVESNNSSIRNIDLNQTASSLIKPQEFNKEQVGSELIEAESVKSNLNSSVSIKDLNQTVPTPKKRLRKLYDPSAPYNFDTSVLESVDDDRSYSICSFETRDSRHNISTTSTLRRRNLLDPGLPAKEQIDPKKDTKSKNSLDDKSKATRERQETKRRSVKEIMEDLEKADQMDKGPIKNVKVVENIPIISKRDPRRRNLIKDSEKLDEISDIRDAPEKSSLLDEPKTKQIEKKKSVKTTKQNISKARRLSSSRDKDMRKLDPFEFKMNNSKKTTTTKELLEEEHMHKKRMEMLEKNQNVNLSSAGSNDKFKTYFDIMLKSWKTGVAAGKLNKNKKKSTKRDDKVVKDRSAKKKPETYSSTPHKKSRFNISDLDISEIPKTCNKTNPSHIKSKKSNHAKGNKEKSIRYSNVEEDTHDPEEYVTASTSGLLTMCNKANPLHIKHKKINHVEGNKGKSIRLSNVEEDTHGTEEYVTATTSGLRNELREKKKKDIVVHSDTSLKPWNHALSPDIPTIENEAALASSVFSAGDHNETRRSYFLPTFSDCLIGNPAPVWTANALFEDDIITINSSKFIGKYLVIFFYPLDFGVLPKMDPPIELFNINENYEIFRQLNTEVVGCSVDSCYTHKAFIKYHCHNNNLPTVNLKFPLLADVNHKISRAYRVYSEALGHSCRGFAIIDPKGILVLMNVAESTPPVLIEDIINKIRRCQLSRIV